MTKDSKELELLVRRIQQQLAPEAEVIHDARLPGRHSGRTRQIDVLVRQQIGQFHFNIIVDCKDYSKPVDVKGVEEFAGLCEDVGAHKGVLVCPMGFSSTAKKRAEVLQIDLYSPVDTEPHKWQASLTMPALCIRRRAGARYHFGGAKRVKLHPRFFEETVVFDEAGNGMGTAYSRLATKWNGGEFDSELGRTGLIDVFETTPTFIDDGFGERVPVRITAELVILEELFYGQIPVAEVSGFKDEVTGDLITNSFTVGIHDPNEILREWQRIECEDDAEAKPVFVLRAVEPWPVEAAPPKR